MRRLIFLFLAATALAFGQDNSSRSLFGEFDNQIQPKNAAYNNGKIHFNAYRSIDKTFRYYLSADYVTGDIVYNGQIYGNIALKYDLLSDELIIKFEGENNQMGFNAVKQKVNGFYIGGLRFSNLDLVPHPGFISGFYEQTDAGKITLYTKFAKIQFEALTNEKKFYTYKERNEFILHCENEWFVIDSQRDAARAFPKFEKNIRKFFKTNAPLEKADRRQFMKKLAAHLGTLLNTDPI